MGGGEGGVGARDPRAYIYIYIYIYIYTHMYKYIYIYIQKRRLWGLLFGNPLFSVILYVSNGCASLSLYIYGHMYIYIHMCVQL